MSLPIYARNGDQLTRRGWPSLPFDPDAQPVDPPIVAPSTFTVTPIAGGLVVDWNDVPAPANNFGRYEIRWNTTTDMSGRPWRTSGFASNFTITDLNAQIPRWFEVRAVTTLGLEGTPSALQGPHTPLAATVEEPEEPGTGTRDPFTHPFTPQSIWNKSIVNGVAVKSASSGDNVSLLAERAGTGNGGIWVNQSQYSHPPYKATTNDPIVTITDTSDPVRSVPPSAGIRINPNHAIATGNDRHLHVLQPDGRTMVEMIGVRRDSSTQYRVNRVAFVDLRGSGIGPRDMRGIGGNGTRAYGGSAVGGLIRSHEVDECLKVRDGLRSARGAIPHTLALALRPDQMLFRNNPDGGGSYNYYTGGTVSSTDASFNPPGSMPGWQVGTNKKGFGRSSGYHWPASEQDYTARPDQGSSHPPFGTNNYTGQFSTTPGTGVPMGTYVCIPSSVNLAGLGWSWSQLCVGYALQDYGAYVTDRSGDAAIYVETYANGDLTRHLLNATSWNATRIRAVWTQLRIVVPVGYENVNGGPLDAPRRRPDAPNLS